MKALLFVVCFLMLTLQLSAQPRQEAATLAATAIAIPDTATYSIEAIARYTDANCPSVAAKIHTLYQWVTTRIAYDTDSMYHYNWSKARRTVAQAALRRRKGVCENFAALFVELLSQCGIPAWVVNGYTRPNGTISYSGHSWCAVQQGSDWWLCDPTWQVGQKEEDRWLMVHPDDFLHTHMPFDPLWQLRYHPIGHKDFRLGNIEKQNGPYFNYPDTLRAFFALDSLRQLEAFARRMYQAGLENQRLKIWHSYNEMRIAIIYGDKDMELYNTAVALLNQATSIFNGFVRYRNQQFKPARPDAEVAVLLLPIGHLITDARQHLAQMGQVVENFQYDTGAITERLAALEAKVKAQQSFIDRYLATAPVQREKLFLK
jgi:hypothetical protein